MKILKINEISDKRIQGRTVQKENAPLNFFWGGTALELNVRAKEVWCLISADYDCHEIYVAVEINGFQIARFIAPKEPAWICLAYNINPKKENLIAVIKDTQPMPDDFQHILKIHEIKFDDNGFLCKIKPRKMKIEFIGDSITSGEGLAGRFDEMDWITPWMSASKTFAMKTAKNLNADCDIISQCGWGFCWGWDGNIESKIPPYYDQVCGILKGPGQVSAGCQEMYSFNNGADFVVINLGTNDNTGIPFHKEENYEKNLSDSVVNFLKKIRKFNPNSKIIWCWGMINLNIIPDLLKKSIKKYSEETGDKFVYGIELDSMEVLEKGNGDKGSRGHPGSVVHQRAAEKLTSLIQSLE